jgi:hypothetical protein
LLPAQPAPAGLQSGRVLRELAVSPSVPGSVTWTRIATDAEVSSTSSWSTAIPRALRSIMSSSGLLRTRWTSWVQINRAGAHVLILSLSSGAARAAIMLDGQPQALVQVDRACNAWTAACPPAPSNAAASAGLAAGWHEIEVTAVTQIGAEPAIVSLYARGPRASMPAALIPSAPRAAAVGGAP